MMTQTVMTLSPDGKRPGIGASVNVLVDQGRCHRECALVLPSSPGGRVFQSFRVPGDALLLGFDSPAEVPEAP